LLKQVLALAAFVLITLFEVPGILKRQHYRDLIVFTVLVLTGLVLSMVMLAGISVPSPVDALTMLTDYLSEYSGIGPH